MSGPERAQRRGRRIAMTPAERDAYLEAARTCRVATNGSDGTPHVAPLWFVWDGAALWLNSIVNSRRWTDIARDPRLAVVVDDGETFAELRGVELRGRAEPVGDVPRTSTPDAELAEVERCFGDKYAGGAFVSDGRHAWLRMRPTEIVSWDFTKASR